ncbi:MAG: hypothetical protein GY842_20415 [bacterium]|nr:hypothetical protein [bacterium]
MSEMRLARAIPTYILLLALGLAVGTAWHEVVGHGLISVICGGRITGVEVLGIQLWPEPAWTGWPQRYGYCSIADIPTSTGRHLTDLAGSLSTLFVAVGATVLLWVRRWQGWGRLVLIVLSLWWIDVLTYTLPSWGLRRSILWGPVHSEPYDAAVALGVPGGVFQMFVVGSSILLAVLLLARLCRSPAPATHRSPA